MNNERLISQRLKRYLADRTVIGIILVIFLFALGFILNNNYLSSNSLGNIFTQAGLLSIAALGQTLVIISGGVDLSIPACISLGAVISALSMKGDNSKILPTVVILLGVGIIVGLVNALGVVYAKVPALVMTLAVSNVLYVMQLIVSNGSPTGSPAKAIRFIGSYRITRMFSLITLIAIIIIIGVHFFLKHNNFAKQLYAVGNNRNAAFLAGVNTNRVLIYTYIISAVISSLMGMLLIGYVNFPYINMGAAYGMQTVVAVIIGGATFAGGVGKFIGTVIGALVLVNISNILIVIRLDDAVKNIVNGIVLLVILVFYTRGRSIRQ